MPRRMPVPLYLVLNALAGLLLIGGTAEGLGAGRDFLTVLPLLLIVATSASGLGVFVARGRAARERGLGAPGFRSRLGRTVALRPFEADARTGLRVAEHVAAILGAMWLVGRLGGSPNFRATPAALAGVIGYVLLYRLLRPLDGSRSLGAGEPRSRTDEWANP